MSTQKNKRQKVFSTLLSESDRLKIETVVKDLRLSESQIIRAFVKLGLEALKKKKITPLELLKLGAYSNDS